MGLPSGSMVAVKASRRSDSKDTEQNCGFSKTAPVLILPHSSQIWGQGACGRGELKETRLS